MSDSEKPWTETTLMDETGLKAEYYKIRIGDSYYKLKALPKLFCDQLRSKQEKWLLGRGKCSKNKSKFHLAPKFEKEK
ncbi:unnamed protein product [Timema podura]|uniref:Uncharacterized protein n=1 Tax=Timema podura TaxID=61482 RepID=A0ABN7P535_TIMPD|nr:unnamed protein product [Timema podura]